MAWKLKRKTTPGDHERIKSLEDQMADASARLDAALAESRRLSAAITDLLKRDPMSDPRKSPTNRFGPPQASDFHSYDPDDTVN